MNVTKESSVVIRGKNVRFFMQYRRYNFRICYYAYIKKSDAYLMEYGESGGHAILLKVKQIMITFWAKLRLNDPLEYHTMSINLSSYLYNDRRFIWRLYWLYLYVRGST